MSGWSDMRPWEPEVVTSVYVIAAEGSPMRVGIAKDPRARLRDLGTGTSLPLRLAHVEDPGDLDAEPVTQECQK